MSKIGAKAIAIPGDVKIEINDGLVRVSGPKGFLERKFPENLILEKKDNFIKIYPKKKNNKMKILWGTWRSHLYNMIFGVKEGFSKELQYEGVGYRAELEGKNLVLNMGFSHPVIIESPEGIEFKIEKKTIKVAGINKELVGMIAAKIRKTKPPEPYKGKGIRYQGETIKRKEGKRAATAAE